MKRILLTGMSGTGKSTVVEALAKRGFKAIDTDYGWCESDDVGEWIWKEQRIQELLSTEDTDVLFVAGCTSNQGKFYEQFDLVILLIAPTQVLVQRIRDRTENPFGKSPEELARVMSDLENIEPLLRKSADALIETSQPLNDIVEVIMRLVSTLN